MSFKHISLDLPGNIKFLPVHKHYIADDCSLSMLFIMTAVYLCYLL
jgi:hypothetical protein